MRVDAQRAAADVDRVADGRDAAQLAHDVAAHRFVGSLVGHGQARDLFGEFVRPEQSREVPVARGALQQARPDLVVFVGHFPDDFLHQVLQGGDAGGAAVFVQDDGQLQVAFAQFGQQGVQVDGFGDAEHVGHDGAGFAALARRSAGTATAFLTWTTPRMSSEDSPITGNREYPCAGRRPRCPRPAGRASMVSTRMRGS